MIGMQGKDPVHRFRNNRVHHIGLCRDREAHVQEVRRVIEVVARINEGLTHIVFIGHCGDGRHLGDHAYGGDFALPLVIDIKAVVVEGRHRADHAHHRRHRVAVAAEATEEIVDLLVQHGVPRHAAFEVLQLRCVRQLAV
ncbi:hypothetical protein GALL_519800 [mine drainage metagenome]|uniref:Uncharacterized protein n=1 Tax=mine drainage metagenome TaxID=410659 RepID=A0A1J5PF48_9ZZZZ